MSEPAPVLVLALGNPLLGDDGAGIELLKRLRARLQSDPDPHSESIELLDGGTQGIALLPRLAGRRALLVLDAVALGDEPGCVHHLRDPEACAAPRSTTAHEGNASELLSAARLLGDLPAEVEVVGIEPANVRTGIGLSEPVRQALEPALERALALVRELARAWGTPAVDRRTRNGSTACTS